jgi:Arc/MetJ-type ribon-helix-helix transcriptional regulator
MHAIMKFEGVLDRILEQAVKKGLVKTKSEALRMGVIELNNHYRLIEEQEDKEDIEYVRKAKRQLASGKIKLLSEKELKKALAR